MSISINKRSFVFEVVNPRTKEVYDLKVDLPRNITNRAGLKSIIEAKAQDLASEIFKNDLFQHAETISTNLLSSNPFDIEGKIAGFNRKLRVQTGKLYKNLNFLKNTILGKSPVSFLSKSSLSPFRQNAPTLSNPAPLVDQEANPSELSVDWGPETTETLSTSLLDLSEENLLFNEEGALPSPSPVSYDHFFLMPTSNIDRSPSPSVEKIIVRHETEQDDSEIRILLPTSPSFIDESSYKNYLERDFGFLEEEQPSSPENEDIDYNTMLNRPLVFFNEIGMQLYQERRIAELFDFNLHNTDHFYDLSKINIPVLPSKDHCLNLIAPTKTSMQPEYEWPQKKGWFS